MSRCRWLIAWVVLVSFGCDTKVAHESSLDEKVDMAFALQGIKILSRNLQMVGTPNPCYLRIWTERWVDGKKVSDGGHSRSEGNGPFSAQASTRVLVAAHEITDQSGKLEMLLRFPEVAGSFSVEFPAELSPRSDTEWQVSFFSDAQASHGEDELDLLALFRSNVGHSNFHRQLFDGDTSQKLETVVVKIAFSRSLEAKG